MCCSSCCKKKKKPQRGEDEVDDHLRKRGQWNTYSVSFFENMGNCWCCIICCPFAMADLYHYTCNMPWGMALLFGTLLLPVQPFVLLPMRMRIRSKHKLEGSICNDICCLLLCCWPLHICQVRDEILYLRRKKRWHLSYSDVEDDTPPWLRFREMLERCKKKKKTSDDDEDDADEDDDDDDDEKNNDSTDEGSTSQSADTDVASGSPEPGKGDSD